MDRNTRRQASHAIWKAEKALWRFQNRGDFSVRELKQMIKEIVDLGEIDGPPSLIRRLKLLSEAIIQLELNEEEQQSRRQKEAWLASGRSAQPTKTQVQYPAPVLAALMLLAEASDYRGGYAAFIELDEALTEMALTYEDVGLSEERIRSRLDRLDNPDRTDGFVRPIDFSDYDTP